MPRDAVDAWIAAADARLARAGFRLRGSRYALLVAALGLSAFLAGLLLFRNLAAALLMAASAVLLPDQAVARRIEARRQLMIDQMAAAVRVFAAEFLATPQVQKGLHAVAERIPDPVGRVFRDACERLDLGDRLEPVLVEMMAAFDFEYGRMFVQLLRQAAHDASVAPLFAELVARMETHLELARKSRAELAGERLLALVMMATPLPGYLFMRAVVPETTEFLVNNFWGRLAVVGVFLSMLLWAAVDRLFGREEV